MAAQPDDLFGSRGDRTGEDVGDDVGADLVRDLKEGRAVFGWDRGLIVESCSRRRWCGTLISLRKCCFDHLKHGGIVAVGRY